MSGKMKESSPFYPDQPVPPEFFVGRKEELDRILRAVKQVANGKPQAVFLSGDYGTGKSSLAHYVRLLAEKEHRLYGVHAYLGGAESLEDVAVKTVEAVLRTPAYEPTITEKMRNTLGKYVGKQELFGVSLNLEAIRADGPDISHGYLPFLQSVLKRLEPDGIKGIFLIFDEINGITKTPKFAHFIKELVDSNALSGKPVPLLLMLCGVEERRTDLIHSHRPVERIFDIVDMTPMQPDEVSSFFRNTFSSAGITITEDILPFLQHNSGENPKVMQIIGNETFWADTDNAIDVRDGVVGVLNAAREIGRKFVNSQVLDAIKSETYHSIIKKIAPMEFDLSFRKADVAAQLTPEEKRRLNNFLQRMMKLKALRKGETAGEYVFNNRMERLYLRLFASEAVKKKGRGIQ